MLGILFMSEMYFCDVPIYRLEKSKYNAEQEKYININLCMPECDRKEREAFYRENPESEKSVRVHLEMQFGGSWRFNEIVGYIRLFSIGRQIRGEIWFVGAKRIVRTRHKTFVYKPGFRPEVTIPFGISNQEIFSYILKFVDSIRPKLKGRFIDSSVLENIGSYVDWNSLLQKT
jgi:hypothetical protein